MAYETGTATNYINLLNKVRIFAAAQGWVTDRDGIIDATSGHTGADSGSYPNELIMHGLNDDSLGKIYAGFKAVTGTVSGETYFNWQLDGFTGFTSANSFVTQPGGIMTMNPTDIPPHIALANSLLTYWLVVNARRIAIVVKVSSYYYWAYIGLLKQYASPGQLPYPLVVGGSRVPSSDGKLGIGTPSLANTAFFDPNFYLNASPMRLRRVDGAWSFVYNRDAGDSVTPIPPGSTWPYHNNGMKSVREDLGGNVNTFPVMVLDKDPASTAGNGSIMGELDGIYAVPGVVAGVAQVSENTLGSTAYMVFQNVHQTGSANFAALKLS